MYPNGITITNTYDSLNRLTSTTSKKPDGTSVITGEYKYDAAGNVRYILQETAENKHLLLVSYDDYDRMVKEEMKVDGDMYTAQPEWDHSYDDADNYNGWSEYVVIPGPGVRFVTGGRSHTQMNSLNQVGKTIYFPGDSMEARYGYDEMGNMAQIISFYYNAPVGHQEHIINYTFDGFGRMIKIENEERIIEYEYDYRGRLMGRIERELPNGENVETARMSYSGGTSVLEKDEGNTLRFYRGSDMGGGVGGLLYAEDADSSGLNYKHYNLRGDIVATTDSGGSILSELRYLGNGDIEGSSGTQPADKFKHNTKRAEDGFVNEGRRYRDIEMMRFTSPDPLEYIDGLNCYIYCGNNPWGRFDPYGLYYDLSYLNEEDRAYVENIIENISRSDYGKDKNSAFYRINNSDEINVRIEVSHGFWGDEKNRNEYISEKNVIRISVDDAKNNEGYLIDNGKGNAQIGKVSVESQFVHESQHKIDDVDKIKDGDIEITRDTGERITKRESRALDEQNKYNRSVGEPERIAYNVDQYITEKLGKVDNPELFEKNFQKMQDYEKKQSQKRMRKRNELIKIRNKK